MVVYVQYLGAGEIASVDAGSRPIIGVHHMNDSHRFDLEAADLQPVGVLGSLALGHAVAAELGFSDPNPPEAYLGISLARPIVHPLLLTPELLRQIREVVATVPTRFSRLMVRSYDEMSDETGASTAFYLTASVMWSDYEADCATDEVLDRW